MSIIYCEIKLDFPWSKDFITSEILNNTEVPAKSAADLPMKHLLEGLKTSATLSNK